MLAILGSFAGFGYIYMGKVEEDPSEWVDIIKTNCATAGIVEREFAVMGKYFYSLSIIGYYIGVWL